MSIPTPRAAIFATWDGWVHGTTEEERPAPPGAHSVTLCYGTEVIPNDSGDWITDPRCTEVAFQLPEDTVVIGSVRHGR